VNLAQLIEQHPADQVALISQGRPTTYGELRAEVEAFRRGLLGLGVAAGDRVALLCGNSPSFVTSYLAVLGMGAVVVPLNPASPGPELTGQIGSYDAAIAGIRHARAAGLKVTILGILSAKNAPHLQRYVDLAKQLDCDQVGVLRLYPLGRARKNWAELSLTLPEMMAALDSLKVPPSVQLMQSWHPKDGNCCWQTAAVTPQGDSVGCPYMREYVNYGNITERSLLETWDHPLYRQLRANDVEDSCPDCSTTQGTHGGCRSTAYAFTGRFTAPDPYCSHHNKGEDLRVLPQWLLRESP